MTSEIDDRADDHSSRVLEIGDNGATRRLLDRASPSGREPPALQAAAPYPSFELLEIVARSFPRPMRVVLSADAGTRARGLTSAE